MQINAEVFIEKFNQYSFKDKVFLIFGNNSGLISDIENLIFQKLTSYNTYDKKVVDLKINKNPNFKELLDFQSLFHKNSVINIKNPDDSIIDELKKIEIINRTIIINGEKNKK